MNLRGDSAKKKSLWPQAPCRSAAPQRSEAFVVTIGPQGRIHHRKRSRRSFGRVAGHQRVAKQIRLGRRLRGGGNGVRRRWASCGLSGELGSEINVRRRADNVLAV